MKNRSWRTVRGGVLAQGAYLRELEAPRWEVATSKTHRLNLEILDALILT